MATVHSVLPSAAAAATGPSPRRAPQRPGPLRAWALSLAMALAGLAGPAAQAHSTASEASLGLSALPVVVSVAAPAVLLSGGAVLTVVSVQASANGTVWVLERASDGARSTLRLAGDAVVLAGTVVAVSALTTGWLLSSAGRALCFIPNEQGLALLHHEQVTR